MRVSLLLPIHKNVLFIDAKFTHRSTMYHLMRMYVCPGGGGDDGGDDDDISMPEMEMAI